VAGQRAPRVKAMFRYFNQFGELEPNELDVLLCDEAHRIGETSANRYAEGECADRYAAGRRAAAGRAGAGLPAG
jgi:superfamily II DNA or RNA helicase